MAHLMARRAPRGARTRHVAALLVLCAASVLPAQDTPAPRHTLDSVLVALERAADVARLSETGPDVKLRLDSLVRALRAQPAALDLTVEDLAAIVSGNKPGILTIARWSPEAASYASDPMFRDAVDRLASLGNRAIGRRLDSLQVPAEQKRALLAPLNAFHGAVLRLAQAGNEEKLQRFELKYGPGAPTLNGVEVILNYLAQWVPRLGPDNSGPSRFEIISAYRTLELAINPAADTAKLVATAQFGLRSYFWNPAWGTGNRLERVLRPRHASAGIVLLGPSEKPFVRAWGAHHRRGVFLGWGDLHAAYVFESPRRVIVGTGKKLVPYAF